MNDLKLVKVDAISCALVANTTLAFLNIRVVVLLRGTPLLVGLMDESLHWRCLVHINMHFYVEVSLRLHDHG